MGEFAEALSHARTTAAVGQLIAEAAGQRIGISGFAFLRISGPIISPTDVFAFTPRKPPTRAVAASLLELLPLAVRELTPFEPKYASRRRIFDIAEFYPPDVVRRSKAYNEYWRPLTIERQLVAFLGTTQVPIGYIGVTRSAREAPFTQRDLDALAAMRDVVEGSLTATRYLGFGTLEDALTVLARATPGPWLLFDAAGKLLWLTDEARARLWPDATQVGRSLCRAIVRNILLHHDEALEQLRAWVRAEARSGDTALPGGPTACHAAVPGEQLVLRRFETKSGPLFLVGFAASRCARGAFGGALARETALRAEWFAREHSLTARQTEVLVHLASGKANKTIAALLGRAENTVELHVTALFAKLGCECRAELVARFWTS
jgi:DNA-binding CsgD family transcriptional regulator